MQTVQDCTGREVSVDDQPEGSIVHSRKRRGMFQAIPHFLKGHIQGPEPEQEADRSDVQKKGRRSGTGSSLESDLSRQG